MSVVLIDDQDIVPGLAQALRRDIDACSYSQYRMKQRDGPSHACYLRARRWVPQSVLPGCPHIEQVESQLYVGNCSDARTRCPQTRVLLGDV